VNWEAVGTIAEIVGAAGVIASLLYLAAQIRQSTKVARAEFNEKFANYVDQQIKFVTGDVEK